jgi:Cdc6-like AAA superfamily ATPase
MAYIGYQERQCASPSEAPQKCFAAPQTLPGREEALNNIYEILNKIIRVVLTLLVIANEANLSQRGKRGESRNVIPNLNLTSLINNQGLHRNLLGEFVDVEV